jgi:DnaJ-class molecular chaperone
MACKECGGTGSVEAEADCPDCAGSGNVPCPDCQGTGKSVTPCAACSGTGFRPRRDLPRPGGGATAPSPGE